jgi:P4 family phage/plasmid primase-like protien
MSNPWRPPPRIRLPGTSSTAAPTSIVSTSGYLGARNPSGTTDLESSSATAGTSILTLRPTIVVGENAAQILRNSLPGLSYSLSTPITPDTGPSSTSLSRGASVASTASNSPSSGSPRSISFNQQHERAFVQAVTDRVRPPTITVSRSEKAKERPMPELLKDLQSQLLNKFVEKFPIEDTVECLQYFIYGKDYEHAVFVHRDPTWNGNIYSADNGGDKVYLFNISQKDSSQLWILTNKKGIVATLGQYFSGLLAVLKTAIEEFGDSSEKYRLLKEVNTYAGGLSSSGKCKSVLDMLLPIAHSCYNTMKMASKFNGNILQFPLTPLKVFDLEHNTVIDLHKEHHWTFSVDIPVDINTADSQKMEDFVLEIMGGNLEKALFLQRWFGYCLTGLTKERKLLIFWGIGNNGKSTLLSLTRKILGPFFLEAKKSLIANIKDSDPNAASSALAGIKNVRLMVVSETNSEDKIDVGFAKKFVSGKEQLSGRKLHAEEEQFDVHAKLVIQTNNKPEIPPDAKALWNRVLFMAFNQQYVENPETNDPAQKKINLDLEDQLAKNLPGVAKWMILGAQSYKQIGLAPPKSILQETKDYKDETDDVAHFLETMCLVHKDREQKTELLTVYEKYRAWHLDNGQMSLFSKRNFGEVLSSKNLKSFPTNGKRYFPVTFKPQASQSSVQIGLTAQESLRIQIPLI